MPRRGYEGAVIDRTPGPPTHVLCSPRRPVRSFPAGFIDRRLYERNLEQNQLIAACCRHPENHDIEAWKSHPDELTPDIYIFHCTCGRKHTVFCVGARKKVHVKQLDGGLVRYEYSESDSRTGETRRDDRPEWGVR